MRTRTVTSIPSSSGEEHQYRLDPAVYVLLRRQSELREDRVDVALDRALGERQRRGDRRVVLPLRHLAEDFAFARGELIERRDAWPGAGGDETLDDLRVDDRTAARDLADGADELIEIGDSLLQEVPAPARAALEERERVLGFVVLTEDEHRGLGRSVAEPFRRPDSLVGLGRRHADVGQHD